MPTPNRKRTSHAYVFLSGEEKKRQEKEGKKKSPKLAKRGGGVLLSHHITANMFKKTGVHAEAPPNAELSCRALRGSSKSINQSIKDESLKLWKRRKGFTQRWARRRRRSRES
jgi:hypothetical protein